jgi:TolB protein
LTTSPYGPDWDSEPAWSPDGKRIAYTSAGSNTPRAIYVMNADGTARRRLTFGRTGDGSPAWSPDGREILFTCEANRISDICVVGVDGKGRLRLTEDEAENRNPAWQPLTG